MVVKDCVTQLCTHYAMLFIIILECTLSTYKKLAVIQHAMLPYSTLLILVFPEFFDCIIIFYA